MTQPRELALKKASHVDIRHRNPTVGGGDLRHTTPKPDGGRQGPQRSVGQSAHRAGCHTPELCAASQDSSPPSPAPRCPPTSFPSGLSAAFITPWARRRCCPLRPGRRGPILRPGLLIRMSSWQAMRLSAHRVGAPPATPPGVAQTLEKMVFN